MNLNDLRIEVDKCNIQLIQIIKKRFDITRKIGELKAKQGLPSYDKKRERIIIAKVKEIAKFESLDVDMIESIFRIIMTKVVKEHSKIKNGNKNI